MLLLGGSGRKEKRCGEGAFVFETPSWVLLNRFFFLFFQIFCFVTMLAHVNSDRDVLKLFQISAQ